jgi:hypothetical protein
MASSALVKAREHLMKMHARVKGMKVKGEEAVGQGISAVEVFGGAVGGGFLDEKFGTDEGDGIKVYKVHGAPVNLLVGAAGLGAAFFDVAGKHAAHLHDVSKGFLASYGVNVGRAIAKKTETVK